MERFRKEKTWLAIGYIACIVVIWVHLDDFGASEFRGGRLTGPLFYMAVLGSLLFLVAVVLTFFLRRIAATVGLAVVLLCSPFYLYILMPGPYRWIFKGEYSVPLHGPFHWDHWAVVGIVSLLVATILSLRSYSKDHSDV